MKDFTYLSSVVTSDGKCIHDNEKGGGATRTFGKLKQRRWGRTEKSLNIRLKVFNAIVILLLLYGVTAWAPKTTEERRFYALEIGVLRNILGFRWSELVRNADIKDMLCKALVSLKLTGA